MKLALLDSNIVIYFLKGDRPIIDWLSRFNDCLFAISIVTWIEALVGSFHEQKNIEEMAAVLNNFLRLPLNEKTAKLTAQLMQNDILSGRKKSFQDSAIASTALSNNIPLLTNNPKDFRRFKGLKIVSPSN